jgi:hypothetical protein
MAFTSETICHAAANLPSAPTRSQNNKSKERSISLAFTNLAMRVFEGFIFDTIQP